MKTQRPKAFLAPFAAAVASVFLSIDSAQSQPVWEPTGGPEGGQINALVVAPDETVFAATANGGILSSDDNGESWSRSDATRLFETVRDLAVNSQGHLFGASSYGLRRSMDGGQTWDLRSAGLTARVTQAIAINESDVIFLGTRTSGVNRSEDNGESWTEVNTGLTGMDVRALTTGTGGELYAATNDGVFESADNGENWTDISDGLSSRRTRAIFVDGRGVLWIGADGLYRKVDSTTAWERMYGANLNVVDTTSTGVLIAGGIGSILVSDDDGASWSEISPIPGAFVSIQDMLALDGSVAAASFPRGILRSDDDGRTWHPANDGVDVTDVTSLVASDYLFAGSRQGVFRSDDLGVTWSLHTDGLTSPNTESLFRTSDGTLLAGTNNDGVFLSRDDGVSWEKAEPPTLSAIRSFAEAPSGDLFAGGRTEILRSTDGSATWDTVDVGFDSQVKALGVSPDGVVFAGANTGIRRSTDGGDTWENVNNGVPDNPDVTAFLFLPDGDVLAVVFLGVLRSSNGGDSWALTGQVPSADVKDIARDSDGTLYVASRGGGVAISSDEGATWTTIAEGLNNLDATAVAVMSASSGASETDRVFVATRGGGVSRLVSVATAIGTESSAPTDSPVVGPNYPNPFSDVTRITVELRRPSDVSLTVFDILGRRVESYEVGVTPAGTAILTVEGRDLPPGAYVYRVDVSGIQKTGIMTVVE